MAVEQLPARVRDFARYLGGLLGRLDQRAGRSGVLLRRDPEGMRACLEGREVPPWDVVEDLLRDLAAVHGARAADTERETARALHTAAAAAHDALPGGREALRERLAATLREEREAAGRRAALERAAGTAGPGRAAEALRADLAWARAGHERAVARGAELRSRLEALTAAPPAAPPAAAGAWPGGPPGSPRQGWYQRAREDAARPSGPGPVAVPEPEPAAPGRPAPDAAPGTGAAAGKRRAARGKQGRRRPRGGARFAGMPEAPEAPAVAPLLPGAPAPGAAPPAGGTPRGARFAGVERRREREGAGPAVARPPDAEDRRTVAEAVRLLLRLRGQGRSGEAHALLAEMARGPAVRLPLAAAQLERAGAGTEWATLLWEVSSLPVPRLVPAADALAAAGRGDDGERVLRQGVARSAEEIAGEVSALCDAGRGREVRLLLDACVRVRAPAEAVRCVTGDPARMTPLLLEAARGVSEDHYWGVVHALRVAGVRGV
ncbi:hypothetical protein [Streptomyces chilikensis]|uniref:UL36 very large tegument protein n=1 Tax=Streptomyces chilikensis TaxID=1194079 RepID=A0ABV3EMF1_9ACTN